MGNDKDKRDEKRAREQDVQERKVRKQEYVVLNSDMEKGLRKIVQQYIENDRKDMKRFLEEYQEEENIREAIKKAIKETEDGKRHRQKVNRKLKTGALKQLEEKLLDEEKLSDIEKLEDFRSIIRLVHKEIESIDGLGELVEYDVSLGIGAYLSIYPESVYLHCGARTGAKVLEKKEIVVLKRERYPRQESYELIEKYPQCFDQLTEYEIENLLCIYKEDLEDLQ